MSRRRLMVCLIAGSVVAGVVATALAAEESTHGTFRNSPLARLMSGGLGRMMVLRSELGLSDQQRQQIQTILKGHRSEILQHAEAVWRKRAALRDAVLRSDANEEDIRKAAAEMARPIADAAVLTSRLRAEIAPVLNETQQEQVAKFVSANAQAVEKFFAEAGKTE